MSASSVISALQTLNASVSGIVSAPTAMPAKIDTARLPMCLCWPGAGKWRRVENSWFVHDREYIVRCYVAPLGQGRAIDEHYQDALELLDALCDKYLDSPQPDAGMELLEIADSGLDGHLVYAGEIYQGFEVKVRVVEKNTLS